MQKWAVVMVAALLQLGQVVSFITQPSSSSAHALRVSSSARGCFQRRISQGSMSLPRSRSPSLVVSMGLGMEHVGRREVLTAMAFLSSSILLPLPSYGGTPVRAPLPPGPADPADWKKLQDTFKVLESLEGKIQDSSSWPIVIQTLSKEPFTRDSMELMFKKAAKNLPKNNLLGADAGVWTGLMVESCDAMESLQVEINFLQDELKAGKKPSDAGDLKTYYNEVKSKMQAGAFNLSK
ncbi:hypothetical protein GUITHDRAFT_108116 [Guillardia theta CCMP2712]|uniref:Uncharacterized protein n=1 Tax=Guillardia theta (strain CCMP2712) TaxID=905079 RepID=L1JD95_GUITC|nr:hypothetical protein GUITHDRAFT_108116 [Guillardia theta CCMP2712]EKX46080.1 hypothetical protein GUITHDRAFT_108116 [Guillardia theta CCMP2712]|eukprot:XP_005833060.1 hypothetical protein GUITHDRAFT_108116 [Guillardia theta CCMP2712]